MLRTFQIIPKPCFELHRLRMAECSHKQSARWLVSQALKWLHSQRSIHWCVGVEET